MNPITHTSLLRSGRRGLFSAILVSALIFSLSNVLLRRYCGALLDEMVLGGSIAGTLRIIAVLAAVYLCMSFLKKTLIVRHGILLRTGLYGRLMQKASQVSLDAEDSLDKGKVSTAFLSDVDGCIRFTNRIMEKAAGDFFAYASTLVALTTIHFSLGIAALVSSAVTLLIIRAVSRFIGSRYQAYQESIDELNRAEQTGLFNLEMVKAYCLEGEFSSTHKEAAQTANERYARTKRMDSLLSAPSLASTFITMIVLSALGCYLVIHGHITIGALFAAVSLIDMIVSPVMGMDNTFSTIRRVKINLARINDFLSLPDEPDRMESPAKLQASVKLRDVTFGYDKRIILGGFSLTLVPGETHVLIGGNGSGKSSLIKLLTGVCLPAEGAVEVLGLRTDQWNPDALRGALSVCTQEPVLYGMSVYDNLVFGIPPVPIESVKRRCVMCGIHDEIAALKDGYDTVLGNDGQPLSRGQRQRLTIARTLLKPAHVYVFDEPFSAIDPASVQKCAQAIESMAPEHIVIVIEHKGFLGRGNSTVTVIGGGL